MAGDNGSSSGLAGVTPRLGYGCMSLSPTFYGPVGLSEEQCVDVMRAAYDAGVRLFNTSDLYDFGNNERMLGKALAGKTDAFISTKWGPQIVPGKGLVADFSRENARKCCDSALERMGIKSIGLFTLRGPLPAGFNLEDTMQELKALVQEGKVQHLGMSEVSAQDVRRAHAVHPIHAVELEWSLFSRDCEEDLIPVCQELGISVMAYSPLGRGLLTGTIKSVEHLDDADFRKKAQPRFTHMDKNLVLVEKVEAMAARKGCTTGQLALAWVLAKGPFVFAIPGTKSVERIKENMGALAVNLTAEEVTELEAAVPVDQVVGDRYADMRHTYHASGKAH